MVLLGPGSIFTDHTGPYWALLGPTGPHLTIHSLTGPYLALLRLTLHLIILGPKYESYSQALKHLKIQTLNQRRETLCVNFAEKLTNMQYLFPLTNNKHSAKTRNNVKYHVNKSKSKRYFTSVIPQMQKKSI